MSDPLTPDDARRFVMSTAPESDATTCDVSGWFVALDDDAWLIELARAQLNLDLDPTYHANLDHARWATWLGWPQGNHARSYRALLLRPDPARYALLAVARLILSGMSPSEARSSKEYYKWTAWRDADAGGQKHQRGRPTMKIDAPGPLGARVEAARAQLGMPLSEWSERLGVASMTYRRYIADERTLNEAQLSMLAGWAASAYDHVARARAELRKSAAQVRPALRAEVDVAADLVAVELSRQRDEHERTAPLPEPPVIPTPPPPSNEGEQVIDMTPGPDAE